jgi:hypothetical protein
MNKFRLVLFALDTCSRMAIDRAGADCVGGDVRRARAAAREMLLREALDGLFERRDADI